MARCHYKRRRNGIDITRFRQQALLLLLGLLWKTSLVSSRAHYVRGWIVPQRNIRSIPSIDILRGGQQPDDTTMENDKGSRAAKAMYNVSVCAHVGGRNYMEDEYFCSHGGDFCAVFDGHGGNAVSRYLRQNLYAYVIAALPNKHVHTVEDYSNALLQSLTRVDQEVQRISHWSYQGSTAVAIWLHHDKSSVTKTVLAANVGDSRAVLSRAGVAVDLTRDHKPNDPVEKARIEARGGKVVWCGLANQEGQPHAGVYRINGNLALARAIGDRSERPPVTGEPEICYQEIDKECDDFIVLGSDGLWDVMSSQEVVSFVNAKLSQDYELEPQSENHPAATDRWSIARLVVEEALRRGTIDNVTVVIIWLDDVRE